MPEVIRRFVAPLICFHRPIKRTYYFLEWNQGSQKWIRYGGPIGGENAPLTLHRSTMSSDGSTPINIAIRPNDTAKIIHIHADGFFLKSGTRNVPILKTTDTIPQVFKLHDYPIQDTPPTFENTQLWWNPAQVQAEQQQNLEQVAEDALQGLMELVDDLPPHLGNIIIPPHGPPLLAAPPLLAQVAPPHRPRVFLEKIPKRIAWLIAEAANDTCPISTNPISPITASVTTCFHVFETEAINEWIARNPVNTPCPVCRKVCMATAAYSEPTQAEPEVV